MHAFKVRVVRCSGEEHDESVSRRRVLRSYVAAALMSGGPTPAAACLHASSQRFALSLATHEAAPAGHTLPRRP